MKRGRLRVLLGAAPGVGKTYTMLEEGARLRDEGRDVVVAVVETHERKATAAVLKDLEIIPRKETEHRGISLAEMDLDAVIARRPDVALVDELAHTNAPGSQNDKRWQDVEALLDAGINVMSTVNVQHIESLSDVVEQITGAPQRETVPDTILRAADQIEVVDLAPQALRDRLAEGNVYPAVRIDAALSNYFRLGNLTALRELTLLWLADEVDSALNSYRNEHGIDSKWEARERVVVALTGGPEGETLIKRGARIAARSAGGDLIAVHVTSHDGLADAHPGALSVQRALAEKLGGTYHQVIGDDIPRSLVEFAKASNATQLVIGVSRRSRLVAALTGPGIGATVVRESGPIDVHIVTHAAAGGRFALPRISGALTLRRRIIGFIVALAAGPLITWLLVSFRTNDTITSDVLAFQLLVVVVALVGGIWPALFAALLSGLTLDFFFVEPVYTVTIAKPAHILALALYILNALLVSYVVDQAARRSRVAVRAAAESELLATIAGSVLRGQDALEALITRTRESFKLKSVRVVGTDDVLFESGTVNDDDRLTVLPVGDRGTLELRGPNLAASERRLLSVIAAQIDAAFEHNALVKTAGEIEPLAQADRMRSALLAAVGHDLRRPLTAATAAVTGLRSTDVTWTVSDRDELLATAQESLETLADLVTNLLDVSRVQAGALAVTTAPLLVEDVILEAIDELGLGPADVELGIAEDLPEVLADHGLLQRVLVNLLENARRYSPPGESVRISASAFAGSLEVRVTDTGPGVPEDRREDIFVPFQRLGDTDNSTGLGLGLALSKGFVEGMGGTLQADDTPGGGLTMVISLPVIEDRVLT
ncbi:MAG: sensor histidine kinase KdpD [Candidatus Saccharibacteria bacterium]|nr:sensor histidine kinase KdpD [Microbacteriaceae bacterium]